MMSMSVLMSVAGGSSCNVQFSSSSPFVVSSRMKLPLPPSIQKKTTHLSPSPKNLPLSTKSPPAPVNLNEEANSLRTKLAIFFKQLEKIIKNNAGRNSAHPSFDPKVLAGNFAPVDELPPTDCPVIEGQLPPSLSGLYIRNGPNPQFFPKGPHHHFDGDGMLHVIKIENGHASFCSRFVQTYRYKLERSFGAPVFPKFLTSSSFVSGSLTLAKILTGLIDISQGFGVANTSVIFFRGGLYALGEPDLPYSVVLTEDGDIKTGDRWDVCGDFIIGLTAHPKIDPVTGEMFLFRHSLVKPYLTYFHFDSNGVKKPDVPIFSVNRPSYLHDFAITKRYAIFPDTQLVLEPMNMFLGHAVLQSDPNKVSRIGVIDKYASSDSDMLWFDVPGFNPVHTINSWEEDDDTIVLIAPNSLSVDPFKERCERTNGLVEKLRINLRTGEISRVSLSTRDLESGVINPLFLGRKNRYAYMATGYHISQVSGIIKLDFENGHGENGYEVGHKFFDHGCYASEPCFVPRNSDGEDEEDGYIVCFLYNQNLNESSFVVMDARSETLEVLASVKLPQRVPYGLHGLYVSDKDLQRHKS